MCCTFAATLSNQHETVHGNCFGLVRTLAPKQRPTCRCRLPFWPPYCPPPLHGHTPTSPGLQLALTHPATLCFECEASLSRTDACQLTLCNPLTLDLRGHPLDHGTQSHGTSCTADQAGPCCSVRAGSSPGTQGDRTAPVRRSPKDGAHQHRPVLSAHVLHRLQQQLRYDPAGMQSLERFPSLLCSSASQFVRVIR